MPSAAQAEPLSTQARCRTDADRKVDEDAIMAALGALGERTE
jgi:hypothetical protein